MELNETYVLPLQILKTGTMKKILIMIATVIVSMGVGYLVGMGLSYLFGDSTGSHDIEVSKMLWALFISLCSFIISFFANTVLHEAGHMIFGLMTGYKFMSFRILNLTLYKSDEGMKFGKFNVGGTLGQCLMVPPSTQPLPYFWYNFGGVFMNLAVILIACILIGKLDMPLIPFEFSIMMLATAAWMFLMNGIPMTLGVPNDGKNIMVLWRHPEKRKDFYNMLAVASEMYSGKRLYEMPAEWFISSPLTEKSDAMDLSARNLTYSLLVDKMEFDAARQITEEFQVLGKNLPEMFKCEVASDRLFLELATLNRIEVVSELYDKKLQKYIETFSKYSPLKSAVLFAYELINNQNPVAAQAHYDKVAAHSGKYLNTCETKTALDIMNELKKRQKLD